MHHAPHEAVCEWEKVAMLSRSNDAPCRASRECSRAVSPKAGEPTCMLRCCRYGPYVVTFSEAALEHDCSPFGQESTYHYVLQPRNISGTPWHLLVLYRFIVTRHTVLLRYRRGQRSIFEKRTSKIHRRQKKEQTYKNNTNKMKEKQLLTRKSTGGRNA